ncbi:hypothetical protein FS749_002864 [Ceratobasidium sp. UAMH 11750]|nr:hypothetical protein FS749_002864 [Ceratobasidium sp. UAMH 11750]
MGRDTKPFLNPETPRPAFPLPTRASLTASFSLPTLSLSSRSKAPPPSLPPLDISGPDEHLLDVESTPASSVTVSSSQPLPSSSAEPPTRPSSPLKPPTSPGSSVPLPSIRSLRSRFSFNPAPQDQPNTPGRAAPTPQKRVTSRRFLPFGNSTSSTPTSNTTPTVPRKSLGDVFALGRSSTSSRLDAASTRSATPSGRSSRSVTSAATLRGWTSTSRHLEPGVPNSRLSFGRPRSHDYSLDLDLGHVVAIGSQDETVRQRPSVPTTNISPLMSGGTLALEESSQEDLTTTSTGEVVTHVALPALGPKAVRSVSSAVNAPTSTPEQANKRPSPRQSVLPPIKIPPPLDVKTTRELVEGRIDNIEKTPITVAESENDSDNPTPTAYPFTPVDDRSDVTSSTQNTPSSAHKPITHEPVPPLPSPSPFRSLPGEPGALVQPVANFDRRNLLSTPNPRADTVTPSHAVSSSGKRASPEGHPASTVSPPKSLRREHAVVGLLGELDGALAALSSARTLGDSQSRLTDDRVDSTPAGPSFNSNAASNSIFVPSTGASGSPSAREEQSRTSHVLPELKLSSETVPPESKVALERHQKRIDQLLSSLDDPTVNEDLGLTSQPGNSGLLTGRQDAQLDLLDTSAYRPSILREDPTAISAQRSTSGDRDGQHLDSDLAKLLSPHRLSHLSHSAPNTALVPTIALPSTSPRSSPPPLPSVPRTPQSHTPPESRVGSSAVRAPSTASPSTTSFRPSDIQLPPRSHHLVPTTGASNARGYHSAKNSPVLSKASIVPAPSAERGDLGDFSSPSGGYSRTAVQPSSLTAAMSRKRSASFDLSGSTTLKDSSDPFVTPYSNGPRRADWLGPRTAKAFAAAGLLDNVRDKDRSSPVPSARSDNHRGGPWRAQLSELGGRMGSIRSHSRLGSDIISPSSRSRALTGTDSSPSYRRGSLDQTAPPSPVSTHRTLVSSATSSSQSQQSVLQMLRERHELETEALLLALAGSKKSERDLRVENEQLMVYIRELEQRIAALENERDQERGKWRSRDRAWETASTADVDAFDKRRNVILAGRPSNRGWSAHSRVRSMAPNRSPAYGGSRPLPSPSETPRSVSVAGMFRSGDFGQKPRSMTPPTRRSNWDPAPPSRITAPTPRTSSPLFAGPSDSRTEFERWHEESFNPPQESNVLRSNSFIPSNVSATSLIPELPGSMSLLVQEAGPLSEDEYSFGSASPVSLTLVQPRNATPKPCPPSNISPVTADFSFNSIPGSPRSLRLRPEEEMHLADLISLQGLEITDVLAGPD